jgi:hypothetical protein
MRAREQVAERTPPESRSEPAPWWWGTNRPGGVYYAGRVHVVHPDQPDEALCELPVTDVCEVRPPVPETLCPDCCVRAMTVSYPPFAAVPEPADGERAVDPHWFSGPSDQPLALPGSMAERTAVMPVIGPGDDP